MMAELSLGPKIIEGKTKIVYEINNRPNEVLIRSKDRITAGDGEKSHELEGKAAISTTTAAYIFEYLNRAGVKTHYICQHSDKEFIAEKCDMIPIEWVTRRIATGSFLRRNPGVKEGYHFTPPKLETFYKDDANNDPQWSREQIVSAKLKYGGIVIGDCEIDIMYKLSLCIFEILEKAWSSLDCVLVDMKVEFGVSAKTGEIVLADIIDSDSWRLWPSGDKRLMKDKQVYRELRNVTSEALDTVKRNFQWVANKVQELSIRPRARVVIFMGSISDMKHCEQIHVACEQLGVPCEMRVTSAHKGTTTTLDFLAGYEGEGIPTVFIAVAGRSNGLGPVLAGNTTYPVINAPPLKADWAAQDIWSSLRLPSGIGCCTILSPQEAALHAAQILALSDHVIWARLRVKQTYMWIKLKLDDMQCRNVSERVKQLNSDT